MDIEREMEHVSMMFDHLEFTDQTGIPLRPLPSFNS